MSFKRFFKTVYLRVAFIWTTLRVAGSPPVRSLEAVNICGIFAPPLTGIGRGALLQADVLRRLGVKVELVDLSQARSKPFYRLKHGTAPTYIYHAAGQQVPLLILATLPACRRAYRIAYLAWEFASPPDWPDLSSLVQEIWTCSEFSREALLKAGYKIPILVVPHDVPPAKAPRVRGAAPAGPGPFTVLCMADVRSSLYRKNPMGSIAAFHKAFGEDPGAQFLLKLNGLEADSRAQKLDLAQLVNALPNAELIDRFLDNGEMDTLYQRADVLISLHRGEGFGLPMLEAMARGIPVVATGYSGNLQFMDGEVAALVGYRIVPVSDDPMYYSQPGGWADPDVAEAAAYLQKLRTDRPYYDEMARRCYQRSQDLHQASTTESAMIAYGGTSHVSF
jgi:glycosyltransferase involved in cell wall biosynthesis